MRWRAVVLPLLLLCLALRTAFPSGWMPMFGPDGVSIMLCPGWDGAATTADHTMAMAGHGQSTSHDQDKSNHANSDHPCAFSVVAGSDPGPFAPAIIPRQSKAEGALVRAPILWNGRSLTAPPPPSTGPPISA
jgi:hypothetical protein